MFDLIRRHGALASAVLCAFDLLELDGRDLRHEPIETRKALLAKLLKGPHVSIVLNEYYEEDGEIVFREACKLGCEGIVSKRVGSIYRRGRSPNWIKVKNPIAVSEARGRRGLEAVRNLVSCSRVRPLARASAVIVEALCRFPCDSFATRDVRPRHAPFNTAHTCR